MADYVGDMIPQAKNGTIGLVGPARQRGEMWRSNLGYFFIKFLFLHRSTPFLRQMKCFGGI